MAFLKNKTTLEYLELMHLLYLIPNSLSISLDVNECLKSPCKKHEVCVNKIKTGYECVCQKNFIRDKASKKCIRK